MPNMPSARLLIVDDEAAQMKALCDTLEPEGYITTGFTSPGEALAALRDQSFDLILTDLMMSGMDGISLLRAAFEIDSNLVGVVMTAHATVDSAVEALKTGALDYIVKPFKLSAILAVLRRALAVRRLRAENIQLREAVGISELSMAIAFGLDFETVLQKAADAAFQQSEAREVSILLHDPDRRELHVAVERGPNAGRLLGKRLHAAKALSNWAEYCRQMLSNPDELMEVQSTFAPPVAEISSDISLPMLAGGRLVGVLNFTSNNPRGQITLGQVKALNILAGAAAAALEASWLMTQLRAAEQRYRLLAENAADIVFRYDLEPRRGYAFVSPVVAALTGYSPEEHYADPELGMKIVHPDDRAVMERVLTGGYPSGSTVTMRWTRKNGDLIWIEQRSVLLRNRDGKPTAIEGIARDITERQKLEEQLRHSQKMEAVGRLTAGIAHDFNNLLTVINGYSDLILNEAAADAPMRKHADEVRKAGEQAAALTRQLLAFGRKQISQPAVLDVNAIVEGNSKILRRVIGENIDFATSLEPGLWQVRADPGQLEQVLMNLAVNARDAMPRGGKLLIQTANVMLQENGAQSPESRSLSPHVMIAVTDTGCGMDADTRSRIFEPFFTTKGLGRGTGLGLSIVYGIVKQGGGEIEVMSEPGMGTTFKVYFPRCEAVRPAAGTARVSDMPAGSETILVVEDDSVIRNLVTMILQKGGYTVLKARNGKDALQICTETLAQIGLVLTDLVMPQMSGPELVHEIKSRIPEVKVLYTSGYADGSLMQDGNFDPEVPFIQKPFSPASLLRKVRQVLDGVADDAAVSYQG